ncbi:hypothetical protein [Erwinia sp. S38]|uniref:hypothetical protein n=1 Tax=Erwinia sp. S38 TaxID=2769338 RepID=UPI001909B2C7|nr:hypothetical protein [Erwinia sp. S38]MBK0001430.1 hypothetical protein [Erwinia sp. S38]
MAHEITLQQAAESADQACVALHMLSKAVGDMDTGGIETAIVLISRLVGRSAAWLLEEQHQRENAQ